MILVSIFLIPSFFLALIAALVIIASTGTFTSMDDMPGDGTISGADKYFPTGEILPPA